MDAYLETLQRLGSETSDLMRDSIANLIVGLTDETGRIVGLELMADRFDAASVTINDLQAELRRLSADAAVEELRSLTVDALTIPTISITDAAGLSIVFPEMTVSAALEAPAPDPLSADDGPMTPEQIRQRAGEIQREAWWSLGKNLLASVLEPPFGAIAGVAEAYGDLTQMAGELRELQRELVRSHITTMPEVVFVGQPDAPTITMPEVVIHGHPSGPVVVMPQVVITAGSDEDNEDEDNEDNEDENNEDENDGEGEDGDGEDGGDEDASFDDGDGGFGDDTGGDGPAIPAGAGTPDVGGVDDGDGLGDDTGRIKVVIPPGAGTPSTGGVDDGDGLGDDTGRIRVKIPAGAGTPNVGGVDDGDGLGDDTGMGPLPPGVAVKEAQPGVAALPNPAEQVDIDHPDHKVTLESKQRDA